MRMKHGLDVWECECGEIVVMGRRCPTCGANYADQLQSNHRKAEKPREKFRKPAEEREFTQSYLFKKKGKKSENQKNHLPDSGVIPEKAENEKSGTDVSRSAE